MHLVEVKHGPLGAICGCRGIGVPRAHASQHVRRGHEHAAQAVCAPLFPDRVNSERSRSNTHLFSIVSSQFEMPAEASAGVKSQRSFLGRLSSFGFSGIIAHGAFAAIPYCAGFSLDKTKTSSLYRAQ